MSVRAASYFKYLIYSLHVLFNMLYVYCTLHALYSVHVLYNILVLYSVLLLYSVLVGERRISFLSNTETDSVTPLQQSQTEEQQYGCRGGSVLSHGCMWTCGTVSEVDI